MNDIFVAAKYCLPFKLHFKTYDKFELKYSHLGFNLWFNLCGCNVSKVLIQKFSDDDKEEWWIVLVVWLTKERRLALFPANTMSEILNIANSYMLQAGFEPAQNLSSDLVEWSCAVVTTTTKWCHKVKQKISQNISRL